MSRLDNLFLAGPGPNWYTVFLSDVVIPNPRLLAWLDVAAGLSVGTVRSCSSSSSIGF